MNVDRLITLLQRIQYAGNGHLPVCVDVPGAAHMSAYSADPVADELVLTPVIRSGVFSRTHPEKLTPLPICNGLYLSLNG